MNKYQEALHKVYFPFVSVITDKKHVAIAEAFATLQELVDQASRPTAEQLCDELEELKRDVKRYFELVEKTMSYVILGREDECDEVERLKDKLSKVGDEE